MKKLVAMLLVLALGTSVVGCANPYSGRHNKKDRNSKHERNVDDDEDEDEDDDEDEEEETTTTTTETTEATTTTTAATSAAAPASVDIDVVEATLDNPAGLNEWFATVLYNPTDREYHVAFARITSVTDAAGAEVLLDEYLERTPYVEIAELEYDDIEYRCYTYEVYFPSDTPVESWGVANEDLDCSICNSDDGATFYGTSGNGYFLTSAWDISDDEIDTPAGGVFVGAGFFAMTTGCDDFYIKIDNYDGENFNYAYCNPFA